MNIAKSGITFVATFLIIGLSHHFTDCLIEHVYDTSADQINDRTSFMYRMGFEMEIFNYFEENYGKCLEKYEKYPLAYDAVYWKKIHNSVTSHHKQMTQFTEMLKFELSCLVGMEQDVDINEPHSLSIPWVVQFLALDYSSVFLQAYFKQENDRAKFFLHLAVYLAAFGADPETSIRLREKIGLPLFVVREENGFLLEKDIDYGDFVEKIRNIILLHYDSKNEKLNISPTEAAGSIQELNRLSQELNSLLTSTLLGETPNTPGMTTVEHYDCEKLWAAVLESTEIKEIFYSISAFLQISSSQGQNMQMAASTSRGNFLRGSMLITLLREIEKLMIRMNYPGFNSGKEKLMNQFIDKVVQGFRGEASLGVHLVQKPRLTGYIIFTKDYGSAYEKRYLASDSTLSLSKFLTEHF